MENRNLTQWIVGNKYNVGDIMSEHEAVLVGFIQDQCPTGWKDQTTYRNHGPHEVYLVFRAENMGKKGRTRYILALPRTRTYLSAVMHDDTAYSLTYPQGIEYGNSIEQLIIKMRANWIFTTKLTYDSKYKEGFDVKGEIEKTKSIL